MLKNYLQVAIRNIKRDKVFSFINIAGLAVGVTCFIALALFILNELSYDRFYKNSDRIYRVYVKSYINNYEEKSSKTPGPLGPTLLQTFPEVQAYTRIGYYGAYNFRCENKTFTQGNIYAVDSSFYKVFSLQFIEGNPNTALNRPNTLVITESAAKKYFGNEDPVGKTLIVNKTYVAEYLTRERNYVDSSKQFLITGLIKDFPKNSSFSCQFLSSLSTYSVNQSWLEGEYSTYIVVKKNTDPVAFENKLVSIVHDYVGPQAEKLLGVPIEEFLKKGNRYGYYLQPLTSIYLRSKRDYGIDLNSEWGDVKSSDISYIYIFSSVAVFILLLAIINFMNLTTAKSEKRAKEVGIRKTLGSNKMMLIIQFITESTIMSFFSVIAALALLELILPLFNKIVEKELHLEFFDNLFTIPLLIGFVLFLGIIAGSYPAFYLSSFRPVKILKSVSTVTRKSNLRSILVISQFAISITLLISTIIIKNQLDYIQKKNLGFDKENLVYINDVNVLGGKLESFKQELIKDNNIISVSNSSRMFVTGIPGNGYLFNRRTGADPISFQYINADYDFLKTYKISLTQGRFFSRDFPSDSNAVVINEAAASELGVKDPVGSYLTRLGGSSIQKTFKIIGVIKDFNYQSLHQKIGALAIHLQPSGYADNMTIRVQSAGLRSTLNYIEKTWKSFSPGETMNLGFVDKRLERLYESEQKTSIVATVFSFLSIFIACLGLFGLAAFVAEQRTKEIGVRKVLGASIFELIMLLSKEFTKWVIIANIIAWPIAHYLMNNWLRNFAYRIEMNWWVYILSGTITLVIALATISMYAIKAAKANPVKSLRYE
jgi:putative ABC transport system permease protein